MGLRKIVGLPLKICVYFTVERQMSESIAIVAQLSQLQFVYRVTNGVHMQITQPNI